MDSNLNTSCLNNTDFVIVHCANLKVISIGELCTLSLSTLPLHICERYINNTFTKNCIHSLSNLTETDRIMFINHAIAQSAWKQLRTENVIFVWLIIGYWELAIRVRPTFNITCNGHEQYEIFSICIINNCASLATFPVSDGQLYMLIT